jgi:hypothetical protein
MIAQASAKAAVGTLVPRGGIEPSPIQLKVHHFLNGDFPVYLPVDPALSSRPRGCRHTQVVWVSRAIQKISSTPCTARKYRLVLARSSAG